MEKREINVIENLDINNLELQIQMTKKKLHELGNNLKTEEQKKNWFEVRIDELKQSVDFYQIQVTKMSKRLIHMKKICSQFELATQCYQRLIGIYEETLKPQSDFDLNNLGKTTENSTKEIIQEIENCKINIQQNQNLINGLLPSEMQDE